MGELRVEQLGGLAGFGGAHLKSWGVVNVADLSARDRETVESLFDRSRQRATPAASQERDRFQYRLSRVTPGGTETVDVSEADVPDAVKASVSARIE